MVNYQIKDKADEIAVKSLSVARDTLWADRNCGSENNGEVFTPHWCVVDMCNMVDTQISEVYKTVLEPACGTGNILIDIVRRKLAACYRNNIDLLWAVKTVYAVDFERSNIVEKWGARQRIKDLVTNFYEHVYEKSPDSEFNNELDRILKLNIVWGDTLSGRMADTDKFAGRLSFDDKVLKDNKILLQFYNWQENKFEYLLDNEETRQASIMNAMSGGADNDEVATEW